MIENRQAAEETRDVAGKSFSTDDGERDGNEPEALTGSGGVFDPNGTGLNSQWDAGIDRLIVVLSQEPSVLRLTYQRGAEERALVDERIRAVSRLVEERWQQRDGRYRLEIEQRLVSGQ